MSYSEKQIVLADSYNAIVTRYGAFEQDDDANGCDYKEATQNVNSGGKCCVECIFFRGGGCAIVNGSIDPMGVCRFWIIDEVELTESDYENGTQQEETNEDGSTSNAYVENQGQAKSVAVQAAYEEEMKILLTTAERNKLQDSDFVFADERLFPVVKSSDIADAVSSWGRYEGQKSFDNFKSKLIALAKQKNLTDALPVSWIENVSKSVNLFSIKSLDDNIYKGIGIVYGGHDLVGDTFLNTTELGEERDFKGMPLYFDHAQDNLKDPIGTVIKSESDDTGVWFQFQLDKRNKYTERVKDLLNSGALGLSTGALNHLVIRENGQIKRWIIGELSLTTTPAEPRTFVNNVEVVQPKTENVIVQQKQYVFVLKK
jgi:hypothetical protein